MVSSPLAHVQYDVSGCLLWTASKTPNGYGRFGYRTNGGKPQFFLAHRWFYERYVGPIPAGLQLDHLCRVRGCVRWDHLEPVTGRENVLRGDTIPAKWAARTECEKCGGELVPCPTGRVCKPCRTARVNEARRVRASTRG